MRDRALHPRQQTPVICMGSNAPAVGRTRPSLPFLGLVQHAATPCHHSSCASQASIAGSNGQAPGRSSGAGSAGGVRHSCVHAQCDMACCARCIMLARGPLPAGVFPLWFIHVHCCIVLSSSPFTPVKVLLRLNVCTCAFLYICILYMHLSDRKSVLLFLCDRVYFWTRRR
jgi:hypothetical protein